MNFRHFGNEKGITLIELMAALSLFAIVIALASTVIFQLMKGNETSGEKISLSQDTNVLVQELRRQYYDGNTKLCLNENDRGLIKDYKILSGNERALQFHNGCIEAVDPDEPLHMELTTMNKSGNELAVSTTLSKQKAHEMKVAIERDNEDDEELPDDKDFSEFACTTNGNLIINKDVKLHKDRCPNNTFRVTGNLIVYGKISLQHDSVTLKVDGAAQFYKKLWMAKNTNLVVNGGADFYDLQMNKDSKLQVGDKNIPPGGAKANFHGDIAMHKDSTINVFLPAAFHKQINMDKGAEIITSSTPNQAGNALCNNKKINFTNNKLSCK